MNSKCFVWLLVSFLYYKCDAIEVKPVNNWSVTVNSLKANVPGIDSVYNVARLFGFVLSNLYYLKEDSDVKWLAYETWNFTHRFRDDYLLAYNNINLVLDGVDTYGNILLNKNIVKTVNNMFRQYVIDIKNMLHKGENEVIIELFSPINYALSQSYKYDYVIPPECPDKAYNGDCHVNKIRKMQASFSWDWGPSVPSMGIWKPVYFEAYNETVIRHVVVDTELSGGNWQVNVDVYFANNHKNAVSGTLKLSSSISTNVVHTIYIKPNEYGEVVYSTSFLVKEGTVQPWWPNGYGTQSLYELTATFTSIANEVSTKSVNIGFRTVELVQQPRGSEGLSFYFKINGQPIYAKGSNLIPVDLLPEKGQDPTTVKKLLTAAKSAHMNMLRVWGGGVYESDYLYDFADKNGLLIWQDFMFACALYPTDKEFLDNVREEVRYQIKRLRSHPSIVLFAGNNENEGALVDNWWGIENKTRYIEDYLELYVKTIKPEFERLTHGRGIYVTSSPSNGKQTEGEGFLAKQPGSSYYGDVHFYAYDSDSFDPATYPIPRFASEYGFQSLPSVDSFLKDTHDKKDLYVYSDFMNYRQHHPSGNWQLLNLITKQLNLPSQSNANYNEAVIFYSQIVQAYSYKIQTERYRNYRSILTTDGRGNTMGALYWQLNDVWAAPTWSSIDYYGRWKMLQYAAVNFFSPIIITGHMEDSNVLNIYVVTDHEAVSAKAEIRFYKWGSVNSLFSSSIDVDVQAGFSKLVYSYKDLNTALNSHDCTPNTCLITLSLAGAPDNFVLPAKLKDSSINSANVKITSVVINGANFDIQVTSDNIALFVWLDAHSILGHFSDNGFLQIGGTKTVKFYPDASVALDTLKAALTVTHLKDQRYLSE